MPRCCLFLLVCLVACSCSSYKQNIMFKTGDDFLSKKVSDAESAATNYVIQVNDQLKLEVYSNKGERLIDPNGELINSQGTAAKDPALRVQPSYLVAVDGMVKFPMIPAIKVAGQTIREAEAQLQSEYNKYYKECYVLLTFSNKRVIVLGSPGGQVIPLLNENVSVVEVLAMAKGIGNDGKSHNVRLIRGDDVYVLDFSTIEGYKRSNMIAQPGDIIYVETIRRPFTEGLRDVAPILSLVVSLASLILVTIVNN